MNRRVLTRLTVSSSLGLAMGCVASGLTGPASAALPLVQPCTTVAASPDFVHDRTAFCAAAPWDERTGQASSISLNVTTDGGRTWTKAAEAGLISGSSPPVLRGIFVSPRYAQDHTVFVQSAMGLFASTDDGATFLPSVPGLPTGALVFNHLTPFVSSPANTVGRTIFANAVYGIAEGANRSSLIDPTLRTSTPVLGTPGLDDSFYVSPTYATDGLAYALAESGVGLTRHFALYQCDAIFTCNTLLHAFPYRWNKPRIWLAPDFSKSHTIFAVGPALDGAPVFSRSQDGGLSFRGWPSAEKLQRDDKGDFSVFDLSPVAGTRTIYFRVQRLFSVAAEQLFISRDDGLTWTRVSYGRLPGQPGARGTMPYLRIDENEQPAAVLAPGENRVFIWGTTREGNATVRVLFCTADNGLSWASPCRS